MQQSSEQSKSTHVPISNVKQQAKKKTRKEPWCSCWSSCTPSVLHTRKRHRRWWCSRRQSRTNPGKHTWPPPRLWLWPRGRPSSPAFQHTVRTKPCLAFQQGSSFVQHEHDNVHKRLTSLRTNLKRDLPVWAGLGAGFREVPNLRALLLLMVSAFICGASPSMTKISLMPINVRAETLKNKFL